MNNDQAIRTTGLTSNSSLNFRDRLTQAAGDTAFLDLFSSLLPPTPAPTVPKAATVSQTTDGLGADDTSDNESSSTTNPKQARQTQANNQPEEPADSASSSNHPARPASLLAAGIDSQLDEHAYAQQLKSSEQDADTVLSVPAEKTTAATTNEPETDSSTNSTATVLDAEQLSENSDETEDAADLPDGIDTCWWNDDSAATLTGPDPGQSNAQSDDSAAAADAEWETSERPRHAVPEEEVKRPLEASETDQAARENLTRPKHAQTESPHSDATFEANGDVEAPLTEEALADDTTKIPISDEQQKQLDDKIQRWVENQQSKTPTAKPEAEKNPSPLASEGEVNDNVETPLELQAEVSDDSGEELSEQKPRAARQQKQDTSPAEDSTDESIESVFGRSRKTDRSDRSFASADDKTENRFATPTKYGEASGKLNQTASGIQQASLQVENVAAASGATLANLQVEATAVTMTAATNNERGSQSASTSTPTVAATTADGSEVATFGQTNTSQVASSSNASAKIAETPAKSLARLPQQAINRITAALKDVQAGDSTLRIRLNPVELGNVDIEISFQNGVMAAKLRAEKGDTHQLLREGIEGLKTRLSEHGINVESLEVELGSQNSGSGSGSGAPDQQAFQMGQDRSSPGYFRREDGQSSSRGTRQEAQDDASTISETNTGGWAVNIVA